MNTKVMMAPRTVWIRTKVYERPRLDEAVLGWSHNVSAVRSLEIFTPQGIIPCSQPCYSPEIHSDWRTYRSSEHMWKGARGLRQKNER